MSKSNQVFLLLLGWSYYNTTSQLRVRSATIALSKHLLNNDSVVEMFIYIPSRGNITVSFAKIAQITAA